jgi:hypothetical protein
MQENTLSIAATTNIAELLDHHPELLDVLVELAPALKNLKNPVMRKAMAKFATLQTAADKAGLPVEELVEKLRSAVVE